MRLCALSLSVLTTLALAVSQAPAQSPTTPDLRAPAAFDNIADVRQRSRELFAEIGKVLTHPRCMNCHPAGEHPLQGAEQRPHVPPVWRSRPAAADPGTNCAGCHTDSNYTLHEGAKYQSIPGHPRWDVAPLSMTWEGKSLREICIQLKDKDRNGGRDLALLHEHIAKDDLVAWGWQPGQGREPAPGSQELAGRLVQAWIDSGAECP